MIYKIISFITMIIFYSFYIYKLIDLNKKNIKTNQAGKGNKEKKVILIERVMSLSNVIQIIVMVISVIIINNYNNVYLNILGIMFGILSIIFFSLATITMKNNWRVGIPEEKTSLVNYGIYKWSRNPAFVGFDLLYISNTIMFFNIPLLIISIISILTLHIQILQEEKHMIKMFEEEFNNYTKHTYRYFGRK